MKKVPFHHKPRFSPGEGSLAEAEPEATPTRRALNPLPRPRALAAHPARAGAPPCGRLRTPARGRISVRLPDGTVRRGGDPATGPDVELTVASREPVAPPGDARPPGRGRVVHRGRLVERRPGGADGDPRGDRRAGAATASRGPRSPRSSAAARGCPGASDLPGAKRDIQYHYDLGNDLYALFLDPSWTYSCAVFERPEMSLQEAQEAKYRRICEKLGLDRDVARAGDRLRLGRVRAARGARVRRPRDRRHALAGAGRPGARADRRGRALGPRHDPAAGLPHAQGTFTHIASIEMLEAIGHRELPVYFAAVDRLLAPRRHRLHPDDRRPRPAVRALPARRRLDPPVHLPRRADPVAGGRRRGR